MRGPKRRGEHVLNSKKVFNVLIIINLPCRPLDKNNTNTGDSQYDNNDLNRGRAPTSLEKLMFEVFAGFTRAAHNEY